LTWIEAGNEFGRNEKLGVAKHLETKPKWHSTLQERYSTDTLIGASKAA
jgi:hypothetical protein